MPVSINYKGRSGNKIFQYVAARIFSEKNRLNLLTKLDDDIVETTFHRNFDEDNFCNQKQNINHLYFENDELKFNGHGIEYIFDDYFHNGNFISNNKEMIRGFFNLENFQKNTKDIVIHLRLFDYLHSTDLYNPSNWDGSEIISPSYYTKILDSENFEKLYIVLDEIKCEWEKKYIQNFEKYQPIFITQTPKDDFEFIRKFDKIICSNSTFSYWSAFLSDASKIYTFGKTGFFGRNLVQHGPHVKNLFNIKNESIVVDDNFYFEF